MAEENLHERIDALADEEQELRRRGDLTDENRARLSELQVSLDRAWDLLRQRDALREAGEDPGRAKERDAGTIEGYLN